MVYYSWHDRKSTKLKGTLAGDFSNILNKLEIFSWNISAKTNLFWDVDLGPRYRYLLSIHEKIRARKSHASVPLNVQAMQATIFLPKLPGNSSTKNACIVSII